MTQADGRRFGIRSAALLVMALTALGTAGAHADTYPNRPVRLIVPFAAGGLNDVVARLVAPYLERSLGQPFIVDNRPAASGIVGTDATAKAPPDGYTLLALRAIASGSLSRDAQLPDLPTVAEQGFPGFEAIQWIGLLTTAGTPKDIIERINAELNRALRDPDLIAKFAQRGLTPAGGTPADFQRTIATDLKNWTETAHAANITAQ